jgi:sugar lactone lactonase YvrE
MVLSKSAEELTPMNTRYRLFWLMCTMLLGSMHLFAQQTCPSVTITGPVCSANGVLTANINPAAATLTWNLNGSAVAAFNASWSTSAGSVAGSNGQGTALNQLNMPAGVFVDASGNVFVADAMNYRVMRWSPGATTGVVVGGAGGDGALPNQLRQPNSVWVDGLGNLYVADRLNHRIQQIAPGSTNGVTVAGGNGQGASLIQLNNPMDVFLDPAGNMFVADANNNRVLRYPAGSSAGAVVAGAGGLGNLTNQLNNPQGVCVDAAGNVYVADALNHRVMRFTPGNQFGLVVAGGNGAGANLNQLNTPTDVWVDGSGNLFIADKNNHRIMRWVQGAATGSVIAGNASGIAGAGAGELQFPSGIHFDAAGNLYVADQSNLRVQRFTTGVLNNKLNIAAGGTYTATVTSFNGCTVTSSPFVVNTSPSLIITGNAAVCEGGSTTLTASGSANYVWSPTTGLNTNTGSTVVATPTITTTYTVSSTAANGCTSTSAITVTVNPKVTVNITGPVCTGNGALEARLNNIPASLVWRLGNTAVATQLPRWDSLSTAVAGANGAGSGANQLVLPAGIFVDAAGSVYIADAENHRIQKWARGATEGVTVAGGNGPGNAANQLNGPQAVFVDATGAILIADAGNHRIQKWFEGLSAGVTLAGFGGEGAALNQLNTPVGIWADAAGSMYISDQNNHRVIRYAAGAVSGTVIAGGNGPGSASNQLNTPQGIYVDGSGNLYIADGFNHRIQRWDNGSSTGITVAGGNGLGKASNQLNNPQGVYLDGAGQLYIADKTNHRIQHWVAGAASGTTIAGDSTGTLGSSLSRMQFPSGLALDATGNLFVSDQNNLRVLRFNINGITRNYTAVAGGKYFVQAIAFNGCNVSSDSITVNESPRLLVNGNTLICAGDSARITATGANTYSWSPATGVSNSTAGSVSISPTTSTSYTLTGANSNGCTATATVVISVNEKPSISIEGSNCITTSGDLIARTSSTPANVRWFRKDTLVKAASPLWAANATIVAGGNGAGSDSARMNRNQGLALSADGLIFVADALNHRIQRWGANGILGVTVAGGNGAAQGLQDLNNPSAVFMDPAGNLYVADQSNHRVMRFPVNSRQGSVLAGGNGAGNAANQLNAPSGVFVDRSGNLYVADQNNHRIQFFSPGSNTGVTIAGTGVAGSGATQLNSPQGVFVNNAGLIYVVDGLNHRIQRFTPGNGTAITVAGLTGLGSAANQLNTPRAIWVDGANNMYIADAGNHRIQFWPDGGNSAVTIAGGNGVGSATNQLNTPSGVALDRAGNLFVSEAGNHRVTRFTLTAQNAFPYTVSVSDTFRVVATSFAGCTAVSNPFAVSIGGKPLPPVTINDPVYCVNATATPLTALGNNLKWYDTAVGGTPLSRAPVPPTNRSDTFRYFVTQTALNGCESDRARITVRVFNNPRVGIVTTKAALVPGDTAFLFARSSTNIRSVRWQWNGSSLSARSNPLLVFFGGLGNYRAVVTDSNNCVGASDTTSNIIASNRAEKVVYVYPNPTSGPTTILFQVPDNAQAIWIRVVNANGNTVVNNRYASLNAGYNRLDLDFSELKRGMYVVRIMTGLGEQIGSRLFYRQ